LAGYLKVDNKLAPFAFYVHMTPREVIKDKLENTLTRETL